MKTKLAKELQPGDVLNRFNHLLRVVAAAPAIHPLGMACIKVTYAHHTHGKVEINLPVNSLVVCAS